MTRYPIYLLMLIMLISQQAHSEPQIRKYMNGTQLAEACLSTDIQMQKSICPTYLMGVSDGFEVIAGALGLAGEKGAELSFCKPKRFVLAQYQRVVTKYLRVHPEELHHGAALLVLKALTEAFPC